MEKETGRVFALLIDADNVSPKYISAVIEEMTTKYGSLSYRRIYGDFTETRKKSWKEVLRDNSITPIQQYENTVGKNSTDSALIIDAMDILYTGRVDGFCLVSSDGDFTRLASRLRESQMYVVVMGEEKTPRAIRMACDKFITLENLIEQDEIPAKKAGSGKQTASKKQQVLSRDTIVKAMIDIISSNDDNGRATHLGELGSKIDARYPDFDTRDYGYSTLSKMIEELEGFELSKKGTAFYVSLSETSSKGDVYAFARNLIAKAGSKGLDIGDLSNQIHLSYPSFSPKSFGYSQFQKFVSSIPGTVLHTEGTIKKVVMEEN
ncbi:MAG: NYN domain-containing protein [Lachnospiraceae bacterium]|nr:NYN domain-containing protein [Lachnospiraceae bacterium]